MSDFSTKVKYCCKSAWEQFCNTDCWPSLARRYNHTHCITAKDVEHGWQMYLVKFHCPMTVNTDDTRLLNPNKDLDFELCFSRKFNDRLCCGLDMANGHHNHLKWGEWVWNMTHYSRRILNQRNFWTSDHTLFLWQPFAFTVHFDMTPS